MARIFISYRREDSGASAGRLDDRLREHFGRDNVFMDIDTIEPGLDFTEVIERTVASCDILIALIGRQWLTSTDAAGQRRLDDPEDFVRREVATALRRDIRVIPVLVQDTPMPRAATLPDDLQPLTRREALELSDTHFHRDVDELIGVLDRVLGVTPSPASPAGTEPRHVLPPVRSSYLRSWRFWGLTCLIFACIAFIVGLYIIPTGIVSPPRPPEVPPLPPPQPPSSPKPGQEFPTKYDGVMASITRFGTSGAFITLEITVKNGTNKDVLACGLSPAAQLSDQETGDSWRPVDTGGDLAGCYPLGASQTSGTWMRFKIPNPEKRVFSLKSGLFNRPVENLVLGKPP
jgi:hypothetical protein